MQNFQVTSVEDNKKYWVSPSLGTGIFVFAKNRNGSWCILATKRGEGARDYKGCWCIPGGYHEFDETTLETIQRELKEETGLTQYNEGIYEIGYRDVTSTLTKSSTVYYVNKLPNICGNYQGKYYPSTVDFINKHLTTKYSEPNEIDEIQFIPVWNIEMYEWAFRHKKLIYEVYKKFIDIPWYKKLIIKWYYKYCKVNLNI